MFTERSLTLAVSRRRKRRRSAAEPKLEAVGSSAWLGASAAAPPHMWKEVGQRRALWAILPWRGLGGCAASHVEGTGAAPGALCYPALDTVGRRDRPRIGAVCPFVRLVSGVSEHIIGDRPRPDPVWETARFSVPPASHGCPSSVSCDWRLP